MPIFGCFYYAPKNKFMFPFIVSKYVTLEGKASWPWLLYILGDTTASRQGTKASMQGTKASRQGTKASTQGKKHQGTIKKKPCLSCCLPMTFPRLPTTLPSADDVAFCRRRCLLPTKLPSPDDVAFCRRHCPVCSV